MAFGIKRDELERWKQQVQRGQIAFITHYWYDPRFPDSYCVTKVGCADLNKLIEWGKQYGLEAKWVDRRGPYPHFDLMGKRQYTILKKEGFDPILTKFNLHSPSWG
ncbi:hypothetical protein PU629_11875 [Pullulanibacillus sp. KACC 23026]|uniref:hypothetical protein n=1 Tax=Pullulanibacillus sp. KACC 23026 TaxID=3028315 RepID=UPI0023AEF12C|nr:hypothetical protein [Pullulanibacillus sp. KACC 23026]WEG10877.1 hypothetical protein PU629_11875 [Pullulanibacillus sp. KACC 23026]